MRAALSLGDHELADMQVEQLISGADAKKAFAAIRKQYALHGREKDFRDIQKRVALKRIHHEETPKPAA